MTARRVLALLECRPSDDAVFERALELVSGSGGYLSLVVVAPRPWRLFNPGLLVAPCVSTDELRAIAVDTLARAVALVPDDVPLLTAVEAGCPIAVIRRRVAAAAHDVVVVGRRRVRLRRLSARLVVPAPRRPTADEAPLLPGLDLA